MTERHRVEQLHRIDAGSRIASDVANVVGARAARVQADALDAAQNLWRVLWLNETNLKIRTRRYLHVTGRELVGDFGDFTKLKRFELAAGNPQASHVGLLLWREIKETIPLEAKEVLFVG